MHNTWGSVHSYFQYLDFWEREALDALYIYIYSQINSIKHSNTGDIQIIWKRGPHLDLKV